MRHALIFLIGWLNSNVRVNLGIQDDMPEGGGLEGEIDACGTPKEVAKVKGSYTRKFSRQVLK